MTERDSILSALVDMRAVGLADLPTVDRLAEQIDHVEHCVLRGRTSISGYNGAGGVDEPLE